MNHEYRNKIANESWIIGVKREGIMNIEGQMIPLPPPKLESIRLWNVRQEHEQQKQMHDMQSLLMVQQQQQTAALMKIIETLIPK